MREYFIVGLQNLGGRLNGSREKRLANNISITFKGKDAEHMVIQLSERGIMCSTRSACHSKKEKDNRVLEAILLDKKSIHGTIRFSIDERTKKEDIDRVIKELARILK